ncbi:hypothetical protein ACSBR2_033518 [Camellia fascicularis]
MISSSTLKRDILKIYDQEKEKTLIKVEKSSSRIAITTDMWTSSNKKRGFMVVTTHYIDDSWTLENRIMRTRWNSTYFMLSTALVYIDAFFCLRQRDSSYNSMPSENDWEVAKDICGRLDVFYNVIEFFASTTYPTINMYFPEVGELKIGLGEWIKCPNELIKKMASSMLDKFEHDWNVVHGIMSVVVLDPRYKMKVSYEEIDQKKEICYDLLDEYHCRKMDKETNYDISLSCVTESSQSRIQESQSNFDLIINSNNNRKSRNVKWELDHYIEDGVLPRTSNFDILSWWRTNGLKYPTLQRIARDILAIPVSIVALEFAFNTSGRLLSPHRSSSMPKDSTIQTILDDYDDHEEESVVTELEK